VSSDYSFGIFKHWPLCSPSFIGQRTKWPKIEDTKGLNRRHKSMKDREQKGQTFEDTKGVIRRNKSMKDRKHNGKILKIPKE
jgi:hypothetical protein